MPVFKHTMHTKHPPTITVVGAYSKEISMLVRFTDDGCICPMLLSVDEAMELAGALILGVEKVQKHVP